MLNVSQVTIANYERGERFPKQQILIAITKLFDVSLDSLFDTPKKYSPIVTFPEDHHFDIGTLIRMLVTSPLEDVLSYTSSWKSMKYMDLAAFYEEIIIPALEMTGRLWFKGELLVSEEHLITEKVRELILLHANRELTRNPVSPAKNKCWMGFCAPGEKHDLALLMTAQILRISGWKVYYLGIQVPFKDLSGFIKKYKPDVLGISITMQENLEGLSLYIRQIQEQYGEQPAIILGGQGCAIASGDSLTRVDYAASLREGLEIAENLFKPLM